MKSKPERKRLDVLLMERGLAESQQKAQAIVLAGEVLVDGVRVQKAGTPIALDARLEVKTRHQKYASRGGAKLEGALEDFGMNPENLICLDIGSSNGGFTDCLLQHGAKHIYAVDVNVSQLDWKLQKDPRVTAIERNARELKREHLPEAVDFVTVDVSFISVCKILAPASACAKPDANFLMLIKPQFELRPDDVGEGGIVMEPRLHQTAIAKVRKAAEKHGLSCLMVYPSRLTGAEGNQEYFLHARKMVLK